MLVNTEPNPLEESVDGKEVACRFNISRDYAAERTVPKEWRIIRDYVESVERPDFSGELRCSANAGRTRTKIKSSPGSPDSPEPNPGGGTSICVSEFAVTGTVGSLVKIEKPAVSVQLLILNVRPLSGVQQNSIEHRLQDQLLPSSARCGTNPGSP